MTCPDGPGGCTLDEEAARPPDGTPACRHVRLREGQASAMTGLSKEDHRNKPSRRKLSDNKLVLAIIPALITGAATYFAGARTGPALGIAPAPTATVTVTQSASSTPGPGGGTPAATGQEILHKSGVQLTDCFALSFADPSLRPYQVPSCATPSGDLSIDSSGDVQSTAQIAVYSGQAGFSQCQADTSYIASGDIANPIANGSRTLLRNSTLCITMTDRIATCYVTDDTTSESIAAPGLTMDVTVYALK